MIVLFCAKIPSSKTRFQFSNNQPEPVGSKAPTFSTELKSGTFEKQVGHDFALLCQAQGFPVVVFRLEPKLNFHLKNVKLFVQKSNEI